MKSILEIAQDTVESIIERSKCANGEPIGLTTGYTDLDFASSGLKRGELICIAGRPGMGKTALAVNIASNLVFREKKNVLIFSLELFAEAYLQIIISANFKIPLQNLRDAKIEEKDYEMLKRVEEEISKSKLSIVDMPAISPDIIYDDCVRKQTEKGLDLVIIDFLQLVSSEEKYGRREFEIEQILIQLKEMARTLDVPIIILSQLSRSVEERVEHRPMLCDFMEECVPNIADTVWFVYRDDYYNRESDYRGVMEIFVAKQYIGHTCHVLLTWQPEIYSVTSEAYYESRDLGEWEDGLKAFIKRLQKISGKDAEEIDIYDKMLIEKIREEDMTGVFELGNRDIQELIQELFPETFEDMVRICAIAHGLGAHYEDYVKSYDVLDDYSIRAEKRMHYAMTIAWYRINCKKDFCQAFYEMYVCYDEEDLF